MPYPLPSWIQNQPAPNPAAEYAQGLHLGAQIQQASNALAQQAQEAQVRAEISLRETSRDFAFRQQQAALQNAMQQQQVDIQQQQLQMRQQQNQLALKNAADRFSAEQEMSQRIQAGEDVGQVMLSLYPRLYRGSSGAGLGTLANALRRQHVLPPEFKVQRFMGHDYPYVFNPNSGAVSVFKGSAEGSLTQIEREQLRDLRADRAALLKQINDPVYSKMIEGIPGAERAKNPMAQAFEDAKSKVIDINKQIRKITGTPRGGAEFNYNPKTEEFSPVQTRDVPQEGGDIETDEEENADEG